MYKIAAVGDRESVLAFKAFGMETVPVHTVAEASNAIRRLAGEDCALIFLTEQLAVQMPTEMSHYAEQTVPAIIMIPGSEGSLGQALAAISTAVERAVGADILGSKQAEN